MPRPQPLPREHAAASLAVGAAFLLLYGFTAAPGLRWADGAEFQTVALLGGIPHSSGYPLWLIAARAFVWLPFGAPEFRVTLFSSVAGAVGLTLLVRRLGELGVSLAASVVAACFLGLTFSYWRVSLRAEVYTLSVVMALLALGAITRARAANTTGAAGAAAVMLGLVLTVHLYFAPAVAIAGLALAWRAARRPAGGAAGPETTARVAGRTLGRLAFLLAGFLAGLTPYLLLVWMDARGVPANFLDLVRHVQSLLGVDRPPFDNSWQRVWWLVTGRNVYPPLPLAFHPRSILAGAVDAAAILALFELGPIAVLLAAAGFARRWRIDRAFAALTLAAILATMGFGAILQHGAMLELFELPAILFASWLVADGVDAALARAGRARVGWAVAIAVLLVAPLPALRVYAGAHPIGPRGWSVREEDPSLRAGTFPGMSHAAESAPWARSVLEAAPRDALILAEWPDFTPLRHLMLVKGMRPDLTLDQIAEETLAIRVRQWQAAHDPAERPIVFPIHGPRETPFLAEADSIAVTGGRWIYVVRGRASARDAAPVPDSSRVRSPR